MKILRGPYILADYQTISHFADESTWNIMENTIFICDDMTLIKYFEHIFIIMWMILKKVVSKKHFRTEKSDMKYFLNCKCSTYISKLSISLKFSTGILTYNKYPTREKTSFWKWCSKVNHHELPYKLSFSVACLSLWYNINPSNTQMKALLVNRLWIFID